MRPQARTAPPTGGRGLVSRAPRPDDAYGEAERRSPRARTSSRTRREDSYGPQTAPRRL
jgi:hypothetical protein